ncbi:Hypothetical protein CINCED_3A000162 [Cinara cedri]|uniref:Uncharacterized protein n=1 Tax=Cinara cedri TaxID=506608 RepID=A0A5E4MB81_9HEMI|nr:Hypothetical protein CINCED_3A000162 [Cinara cedri]
MYTEPIKQRGRRGSERGRRQLQSSKHRDKTEQVYSLVNTDGHSTEQERQNTSVSESVVPQERTTSKKRKYEESYLSFEFIPVGWTIVNYVKSRPLKSRLFKKVCDDIGSQHQSLFLHT